MEAIERIIELLGGEAFSHVKIENGPFMPLCIEVIGQGPRGHKAVSVCHYVVQNGDMCQDPEMCFELVPQADGTQKWEPYMFTQALMGVYQEVWGQDGRTVKPKLLRDLVGFASMWNKNIRAQGFVKRVDEMVKKAAAAKV